MSQFAQPPHTAAGLWEEYSTLGLRPEVPPALRQLLRTAFYTGVAKSVIMLEAIGELPEAQAREALAALDRELLAWSEDVLARLRE